MLQNKAKECRKLEQELQQVSIYIYFTYYFILYIISYLYFYYLYLFYCIIYYNFADYYIFQFFDINLLLLFKEKHKFMTTTSQLQNSLYEETMKIQKLEVK